MHAAREHTIHRVHPVDMVCPHNFPQPPAHGVLCAEVCCRYNSAGSELVCDDRGVAYPVVAGISRLTPAASRVVTKGERDAAPLAKPLAEAASDLPQPHVQPWSQ